MINQIQLIQSLRIASSLNRERLLDIIFTISKTHPEALVDSVKLNGLYVENPLTKVEILVKEGKRIEAIKLYREYTKASLREAKEFVDNF